MQTADTYSRAAGVGVAYHPFLHDYLLGHCDLFDFIELPLDLYLDTARAALLDPEQMRLKRIIAAEPCVWRGSALSLGTVQPGGEAAFPPYLVQAMRRLLAHAPYTDVIGFGGAGAKQFGAPQAMPVTAAAAGWIAVRQQEARAALGSDVLLALPSPATAEPSTGLDCADFLGLLAQHGGTGFVVDATQFLLSGAAPDRLPASHVAALSISSDREADWDMLAALAAHTAPQTIVLRRDRQLFPLDTIGRDLLRAAKLLAPPCSPRASLAAPVEAADPAGLAELHAYQCALAGWLERPDTAMPSNGPDPEQAAWMAAAQSWQNWRSQVDDMHKAQQIAAFMAKDAGPRAPRSAG